MALEDWPIGLSIAAAIVFANHAYVAAHLGWLHGPDVVLETDHLRYLAMASISHAADPLAHDPPFCYRILVPWLASLLRLAGLNLNAAFYLLTQVSLVAFLATLYVYLRRLRIRRSHALFGLMMVGLLPGVIRWYEYQYWMTDPLAMFSVTLALLLIEDRRDWWVILLCAIGVTIRETFWIVFPYYFFRRQRRDGWAAAVRGTSVAVVAPTVIALIIHRAVDAVVIGPPESTVDMITRILRYRHGTFWPTQLYLVTIESFGVLILLLLVLPWRSVTRLVRPDALTMIAMTYASLALALNTDRLLAYAVPVLLPAALRNLRAFATVSRLPIALCVAVLTACQLHLYLATRTFGQHAISISQPFRLDVTISMGLCLVAGIVCLLHRRWRVSRA